MDGYDFLDDFEEVGGISTGGYDWTDGTLWRHTTNGVLLWGTTSGCSCYGYMELIDPEDMTQVDSWQDALDLAKDDGFSDSEISDLAARLMDLPGNCAPSQRPEAPEPASSSSLPSSAKTPTPDEPT